MERDSYNGIEPDTDGVGVNVVSTIDGAPDHVALSWPDAARLYRDLSEALDIYGEPDDSTEVDL